MNKSVLRPCVFFDRDGIVNEPPSPKDRYVRKWADFQLWPAFIDAMRVVRDKGYQAVIITNQSGVGRGHMKQADLDEIHDNLLAALKAKGVELLDIFVCTDVEDSSPRRKPNPGMLLEAACEHQLDLSKSWMVGDQERDIEAGQRAGCRTVYVGSLKPTCKADYLVPTMNELPAFLVKHL